MFYRHCVCNVELLYNKKTVRAIVHLTVLVVNLTVYARWATNSFNTLAFLMISSSVGKGRKVGVEGG
jgi:hypothetical protein